MIISGVFLAPMAGITDAAFRHVCIEQGAKFCYTEMVSAKGLEFGSKKTASLLRFAKNERHLGVQLFSSDSYSLAVCIELLSETYGSRIALFDINMGCPAPKITGNEEGCALMKNPGLAMQLIKTAAAASKTPVTVKFRKGWDENSINAVEFAQMAEQAGASAVTVHGRTRQQFYSGKADIRIIENVKKAIGIPVIGSGDVFSAFDACEMFNKTGCDAVMVARGALGYPFIFREIQRYMQTGEIIPATIKERAQMLLRQASLCCEYKGEPLAMRQIRKHASWYFKGLPGASRLREAAVRICTLSDLQKLLLPLLNDQ